MRRGTALATGAVLATCLCVTLAGPAAALVLNDDDGIVDATETADGYEADVTLLNTGDDTITLPGTVEVSEGCTLTTGRTQIPPRRTAVVTLTIEQQCFAGENDELQADLAPGMPAVRIAAPPAAELTSWAPLGWGMFVGLLCAIVVGLIGRERFMLKDPVLAPALGLGGIRPPAYTEVTVSLDAKFVELGATAPRWKGVERIRPGPATPLRGLDATWSLEDSVVSTTTVGTAGLIALLGSSDLLTALLGAEPSTTITVMTVAALLNAGLIALAASLVRLVSPDGVTVLAAILSTSLVTLAGVSQAVAIGVAAAILLGAYPLLILLALAVTVLVVVLVVGQTAGAVISMLDAGIVDDLPEIPADARTGWQATTEWDKSRLVQQLLTQYASWISSPTDTLIGLEAGQPVRTPLTVGARVPQQRRRATLP